MQTRSSTSSDRKCKTRKAGLIPLRCLLHLRIGLWAQNLKEGRSWWGMRWWLPLRHQSLNRCCTLINIWLLKSTKNREVISTMNSGVALVLTLSITEGTKIHQIPSSKETTTIKIIGRIGLCTRMMPKPRLTKTFPWMIQGEFKKYKRGRSMSI